MKPVLVADTKLYKRLCPSVGPSVNLSVRDYKSKSKKVNAFVQLGDVLGQNGGCPCPPIRNDIGTRVNCLLPILYDSHNTLINRKIMIFLTIDSLISSVAYMTMDIYVFLYFRVNQIKTDHGIFVAVSNPQYLTPMPQVSSLSIQETNGKTMVNK